MISEEVILQLDNLYESFKDYIKSIYIVGSKSVNFINNPHDIDVVIISDEKDKLIDLLRVDNLRLNLLENLKLDIHVSTEDFFLNHFHWHHPFCKLYKGEELEIRDILSNKELVKKDLIKRCNGLKNNEFFNKDNRLCLLKPWYHIYAIMCYLDNDNYTLTEEQLYNINILHDMKKEYTELRMTIINNIIKEIELWQI